MRHFLATPKTGMRTAVAAYSASVVSSSVLATTPAVVSPLACAVRWQVQSRSCGGRGNSSGDYNNSHRRGNSPADRAAGSNRPSAAAPPFALNKTKDGDLSFGTRVAMRDDAIILTEIFKHIPQQGAISIKSLFSLLNEDVQEALCEKHNGLRNFVEQRKQIFTVRSHPTDGVLYVVGNPLVAQQYATRDLQLQTMRQVMGLNENESTAQSNQRRQGGNFGSRGGAGVGGGSRGGSGGSYSRKNRQEHNRGDDYREGQQGQRGYQGNNSNNGAGGSNDRRRPPLSSPQQQRDSRRPYGGSNRSFNSNGNSNSGPPPPRERRPMGSRPQSFGTRN